MSICCLPEPELNTSNRPGVTKSININLRLNKTRLSSYKRRHISISDSRLSSAVIGYCGVVILMAGCLTIIIPDVSLILQCLKTRKLRHRFHTKVKLVSYRKQLFDANSELDLEDIEYIYCSELQKA